MNATSYSTWLHKRLSVQSVSVAFLFGSVVRGHSATNDCDLFLVTCRAPGTVEWSLLRDALQQVSRQFYDSFRIPLAIELLSKAEYEEWLTWKDPIYRSPKLHIL